MMPPACQETQPGWLTAQLMLGFVCQELGKGLIHEPFT